MCARSIWLAALLVAGVLVGVSSAWAQQTPAPASPPADATPAEESVTDDPGADDGGADAGAQQQQQQRRRMVTTTSAQLKIGDKAIALTTGILKTEGPDYESIAKLGDGDVLRLTRSQAIKLKTDFPMTIGDVTLKTENVAAGYAGVYAIWLKKTADGWHFIFNEKADLWGTMYDPSADVAEVPVTYATLGEPTDALKFELPQDGQGGAIKISWGEHEWTAPFTIAN
jgi:hypothetical protein